MRASHILVFVAVAGAGHLRGQAPAVPVQYREPFAASFPIREAQHRQIKAYAEKLPPVQRQPAMPRLTPDYSSVAAYERSVEPVREKLKGFFGVPPGAREGRITKFEQVGEDQFCTVHRVWVDVIDGVEAYGLYLLPKKRVAKAPLLIAQHGGGGNPEAMCGLDTRDNYRKFGPEPVKRGYIVWAPAKRMPSCRSRGDGRSQPAPRSSTRSWGRRIVISFRSTRADMFLIRRPSWISSIGSCEGWGVPARQVSGGSKADFSSRGPGSR